MLIESSSNPQFKRWTALLESRGIKKHGQCLVMGRKLVPELLNQEFSDPIEIICSEKQFDLAQGLGFDAPIRKVKASLFREIDTAGTHFPMACMATPDIPEADLSSPPPRLRLFLALSDPTNLGAVIRNAVAFSTDQIVLLSESANPFLPKSLRASAGAVWNAPLVRGPSIHDCTDIPLVALDKEGINISDYSWPQQVSLLVGEEGQGLPKELNIKKRLAIPMQSNVESLNAMAATSIALFCYFQNR